jgi:ABC-2 type transport system permease protein
VTGFRVLLRKELLEQVRTWRLVVVVIVFAIFGIGSPALARYTPELVKAFAGNQFTLRVPTPTVADAVAQFLKNLGQTGILAAVLLSMGSVATEKERGTAALLLTKPVTRGAFLAAKLVAIAITLGIGILAAGSVGYAYTALLFSAPSLAGYAAMCGLLLLSLVGYASLTFLGSTLVRSPLPAAAIGVGAMVVLAILSVLPTIGANAPGNLNGPATALALGKTADPLLGPLMATIGLIVVSYLLAWLAFRRQEL